MNAFLTITDSSTNAEGVRTAARDVAGDKSASRHPKVTGSDAESAKALRLHRDNGRPDVTIRKR